MLLDAEYIDNYCRDQSTLSMEGKMCMLNEILLAKFENEVSGKEVTFPAREKGAEAEIREIFWRWKMAGIHF